MRGTTRVYTVYGGYPGQESEHWATFRSLKYARAYRDEHLRIEPRLDLGIGEEAGGADDLYADEEWEARFSPRCTSGCRFGRDICGLCAPLFCNRAEREERETTMVEQWIVTDAEAVIESLPEAERSKGAICRLEAGLHRQECALCQTRTEWGKEIELTAGLGAVVWLCSSCCLAVRNQCSPEVR